MNLDTGEIVQLTDEAHSASDITETPDSRMVVYGTGNKQEARLQVLCNHKTSWHTSTSHCHPTWSWDGSRILYASDYGGKVNLYLVRP
jgi:oligogalacturonide lyase